MPKKRQEALAGQWTGPSNGRVKTTHKAEVRVDPKHQPLDARTTRVQVVVRGDQDVVNLLSGPVFSDHK